ncbi:MAG: hypothetical protein K9W45_01615 [Candidatus Heimdallarchaeum aukensis]|uniref:Uncharacterized protein n=1 Tax=Candidatus Heimdallarchaeum aukensis TaxID=2876573 RepID=A0A9Y1FLT8_9ARCH|nr:MAG: hypothetical protein K9W45_01615 [Candidatus Heimdallarchaeum aukensis]
MATLEAMKIIPDRTVEELEKIDVEIGKILTKILNEDGNNLDFIEKQIYAILLISKAGLPMYSNVNADFKVNELLLSGLLGALQIVGNSIFRDDTVICSINYKGFTILFEEMSFGSLVLIVSENNQLTRKIIKIIKETLTE